jgi:2-keto-4-pentenoate hydratase
MDVDIRWAGATLSKSGIIEESGVSAAIMSHPACQRKVEASAGASVRA